jgi:hypothetical protein
MYFRQRVYNVDKRFQDPLYIAFAISTWQQHQLCGVARIAVRQCKGPATVGQLRDAAQTTAYHKELGDKCWAFMKNIRGTAAYWQSVRGDLFSMIATCGAPTWFTTFSADDLGWNDLALVLNETPISKEDEEEFLKGLTREDRQDLLLNDQVGQI